MDNMIIQEIFIYPIFKKRPVMSCYYGIIHHTEQPSVSNLIPSNIK